MVFSSLSTWSYIFEEVYYISSSSTSHVASATPRQRCINPALHSSGGALPAAGPGCGKMLEIEWGKKRNKEKRSKTRRRRRQTHSYRCIYQPKVALWYRNPPSGTKHHQKLSANRSRWLNLDMRAADTDTLRTIFSETSAGGAVNIMNINPHNPATGLTKALAVKLSDENDVKIDI